MSGRAVDEVFSEEELAALKALASKPRRPWWQDYPFLVSVFAFFLSLFTSIGSAYVNHLHDVHDQQTQLSATIAAIQAANLKQIEVHEKYRDSVFEAQASRLIVNEVNSGLHTARKLSLQLGTNASTADLTAVAEGLYGLGDYENSERLLKYGLVAADTANDESAALKDLGFLMIRTGQGGAALKAGNDYFQRAFDLDQKYNLSQQPQVILWLKSSAKMSWANALATVDCSLARRNFDDGIRLLSTSPSNIDFDQARAAATQAWRQGIGDVLTCMPDAATPTLPQTTADAGTTGNVSPIDINPPRKAEIQPAVSR